MGGAISTDTARQSAHTVNLITVKTTKDGNLFFDYVGHLEDTRPFKNKSSKEFVSKELSYEAMQNLKKAAIPIKRSAPYKSKQEKLDEKIEEAYKDELRSGNVKSASFSQFSQSFKEKLNASRTPSPDSVADGTEVKSKDPHSR